RDEQDRLRHTEASGAVKAHVLLEPDIPGDVAGDHLEVDWDERREVERLLLEGNASLSRAGESLTADRVAAVREATGGGWELTATGTVFAQGSLGGQPAWIRSERLDATVDRTRQLRSAIAQGRVRFEAPATRAEADRAEFHPTAEGGEVHLFAAAGRKARLAREQTRVAAETIRSDLAGRRLDAEQRVEATLMPVENRGAGGADGLFRDGQAVHFVSEKLVGENSGERLVFSGGVRGWQGERNLSADRIEMRRSTHSLSARGGVTTRAPREADGGALGESDYVQIAADQLDYDGVSRLATYRGGARVTLVEGWLEADRIEVRLSPDEGGVTEVWAFDDVRIEFSDPERSDRTEIIAGAADRVSYLPADRSVRLFGDDAPATVRRLGPQGATTSGRVLRYQLDVGTLEVESGQPAPARIRGR
ncbi:MAG TPA: LptA/OstA family protein, partial [Candidatus Polarisedimenticolaceae bacterium]|nr:LptA/OstA family protein [Candidatus Polarisedimenticolaceae bacterium]